MFCLCITLSHRKLLNYGFEAQHHETGYFKFWVRFHPGLRVNSSQLLLAKTCIDVRSPFEAQIYHISRYHQRINSGLLIIAYWGPKRCSLSLEHPDWSSESLRRGNLEQRLYPSPAKDLLHHHATKILPKLSARGNNPAFKIQPVMRRIQMHRFILCFQPEIRMNIRLYYSPND